MTNIVWQQYQVSKEARAERNGQKPCVIWFTGLSGSGKSTLSDALERRLFAMGHRSYLLDGDNVRHGLNKDLGFTDVDRVENIRRIGEVAKLFVDAGLVVITAFISPFRSDREMAKNILAPGEFVEVFLDVPLEVCEKRDPKGLYKKARAGQIRHFTGIDSVYEPPLDPALRINTSQANVDDCVDRIIDYLGAHGYLVRGDAGKDAA
jgi:adenylyl-sulfate kinase